MPRSNASASTSGFSTIRSKRKKEGLLRIMSNGADPTPANMPFASPPPNTGGTIRKVNTMPPSAIYDPPTPPLPPHDLPTASTSTPKRPRQRIRYSTEGESSDSTGPDSSDDEVPWWTFTHKGMTKMRQRTVRRRPEEGGSAREEKKGKASSRKSSKTDDVPEEEKPPSLSLGPPLAPPTTRARSHFTPDLHHLWRRSSGHSTPEEVHSDSEIPRRRIFTRSNSAPGAGLDTIEASPHPLSSIIVANHLTVTEPIPITPIESDPVLSQHARNKRQMTAPSFPRLRRLRTDVPGHVSDSETCTPRMSKARSNPPRMSTSRMRTSRMKSTLAQSYPPGSTDSPEESTPRMRRLNTALIKNQLEPIQQHFAHGWPHAGSWQDALYGRYDGEKEVAEARDREISAQTLVAEPASIDSRSERRKTRRSRRYRQALMPPTPKGLGFSPRDEAPDLAEPWKEGKVNQTEFDWNSPATTNPSRHAPQPTGSTIPEGDELSRQHTRMTEKEIVKAKARQRTGRTKREGEDWKVRWKRMMFLDARLTIFLRLMDIAVVATLLALSISIRQELIQLRLPGLIGPSTTLTIAFASFTLFHATTAIYREYFGKPIGLWALRSKMLWVCLDLLFVALWSSALSLATNDYISTPLQCSRTDAWWLPGLRSSYSQLLADLSSSDMTGVTGADLIRATLGIVLPDQIVQSPTAREVCRRQSGCIALSLFALLLYAGNMVLSLFRVFETVRRSANVGKAIMV